MKTGRPLFITSLGCLIDIFYINSLLASYKNLYSKKKIVSPCTKVADNSQFGHTFRDSLSLFDVSVLLNIVSIMKKIQNILIIVVLFASGYLAQPEGCDIGAPQEVMVGVSWTTSFPPGYPDGAKDFILNNIPPLKEGVEIFNYWLENNKQYIVVPPETEGGNPTCHEIVVEMNEKEDMYSAATVQSNIQEIIDEAESRSMPVFFLSGFGSSPSNWASVTTEKESKLLISSTATSATFARGSKYSFSVYPTTLSRTAAILPLYKMNKIANITLMQPSTDATPVERASCEGFPEEIVNNAITLLPDMYYGIFFFLDIFNTNLT